MGRSSFDCCLKGLGESLEMVNFRVSIRVVVGSIGLLERLSAVRKSGEGFFLVLVEVYWNALYKP